MTASHPPGGRLTLLALTLALALAGAACDRRPTKPKPPGDPARPPTPLTVPAAAPSR